jgi:hypothetical protein
VLNGQQKRLKSAQNEQTFIQLKKTEGSPQKSGVFLLVYRQFLLLNTELDASIRARLNSY